MIDGRTTKNNTTKVCRLLQNSVTIGTLCIRGATIRAYALILGAKHLRKLSAIPRGRVLPLKSVLKLIIHARGDYTLLVDAYVIAVGESRAVPTTLSFFVISWGRIDKNQKYKNAFVV